MSFVKTRLLASRDVPLELSKLADTCALSLKHLLRQRVLPLIRCTSGHFTISFGLSMMGLMLAIGNGIDIATAYRVEGNLQAAADAAALAAVRFRGTDDGLRAKEAEVVFQGNLRSGAYEAATIPSGTLTKVSSGYKYSAGYAMPTSFLGFVRLDKVQVNVSATAIRSVDPMDIVLVLDSSGSMSKAGRMLELKKAVKLFLANINPSVGDVQVSVIPFDSQVRIDPSLLALTNTNSPANPYASATDCNTLSDPLDKQTCIDAQKNRAIYANCSRLKTSGIVDEQIDAYHCARKEAGFRFDSSAAYYEPSNKRDSYKYNAFTLNGRNVIHRFTGDECGSYNTSTYECIGFSGRSSYNTIYDEVAPAPTGPQPVTSKTEATETANSDLLLQTGDTWAGCIIDRTQNYDTQNDAPVSTTPATLYPKSHCATGTLLKVRPLGDDFTGISSYIDGLQPSGATNVTIGVQWGMEALTNTLPLTGATSDARKVMVLMTDGENTQNRWKGTGAANSPDRPLINARTELACANAKVSGIEIFTVNLIDGNDALLTKCATDEKHFFKITSAAQLSETFSTIATQIQRIRLTQ